MGTSRAKTVTFALDDHVCLALYTASRAMTAMYRPVLQPLGLTYPQYLVMMVLWQEGATTVGGIGARIHLESSTLSPLIKRLEALGLVRRQRDTVDERTVRVQLTEQGAAMEERAADVPWEMCESVGLDEQERTELVRQLRQLAKRLTS